MTGRPSLTERQRLEIQQLRKDTKLTFEQLAERFDCSVPTIQKAVRGVKYEHKAGANE